MQNILSFKAEEQEIYGAQWVKAKLGKLGLSFAIVLLMDLFHNDIFSPKKNNIVPNILK